MVGTVFYRDGARFRVTGEYMPGMYECRGARGDIVIPADEIRAYVDAYSVETDTRGASSQAGLASFAGLNAYRVTTSTVRFGQRVELELGRLTAGTLEGAARIVARDYAAGLEGYTDPVPVPVEPAPRASTCVDPAACRAECLFTGTPCTGGEL